MVKKVNKKLINFIRNKNPSKKFYCKKTIYKQIFNKKRKNIKSKELRIRKNILLKLKERFCKITNG